MFCVRDAALSLYGFSLSKLAESQRNSVKKINENSNYSLLTK